jgi:two-component system sensor histidine kinase SenX3
MIGRVVSGFLGLMASLVVGAVVGALITWLTLRRRLISDVAGQLPIASAVPLPEPARTGRQAELPLALPELQRLFDAVAGAVILVNSRTGYVVASSTEATSFGLVHGDRVATGQIASMISDVQRGAAIRDELVEVRRYPFATARIDLQTRVAPLNSSIAIVLAEDVSSTRRVDDVRRDFVVNVSHELKTPVGALSLLSEAVIAAADQPDEVRHFADRMRIESARLAHLVGDLVDLSRLQGDDPMLSAEPVDIDAVVSEAVDAMRTTAQAKEIAIRVGGEHGLAVYGVESQLTAALRNLLANAVNYSGSNTNVAIGSRAVEGFVEITVTDQGIGISATEVGRIFERFYRVDQARSRVTGGTGLGLSIVKHVSQNHGGNVTVWSVEGEGSTFTLRLPSLAMSGSQLAASIDRSNRVGTESTVDSE